MAGGDESPFDPRPSVKLAYDAIAGTLDDHRPPMWDFVKEWLESQPPTSLLVAGCGGGRHVRSATKMGWSVTGLDHSQSTVKKAKEKGGGDAWLVADVCDIPLDDEGFDAILSIAVIHHLTAQLAQKALSEFSRLLKPSGCLLVSCWDPSAPSLNKGVWTDDVCLVPWTLSTGEKVERWYHLPNIEERLNSWGEIDGLELLKAELMGQNQVFKFIKRGV